MSYTVTSYPFSPCLCVFTALILWSSDYVGSMYAVLVFRLRLHMKTLPQSLNTSTDPCSSIDLLNCFSIGVVLTIVMFITQLGQ